MGLAMGLADGSTGEVVDSEGIAVGDVTGTTVRVGVGLATTAADAEGVSLARPITPVRPASTSRVAANTTTPSST